ncbi:MAG: hypothetical protein HZA53_07245 [Planctomycetes bacterium]|nr:hypothetical protein [Planctomycetota bacterium]
MRSLPWMKSGFRGRVARRFDRRVEALGHAGLELRLEAPAQTRTFDHAAANFRARRELVGFVGGSVGAGVDDDAPHTERGGA